jgi:hypothetical protein
MLLVQRPDAADPFHAALVPDMTAQRITGIRGIDHQAVCANYLYRMVHQPQLRIDRMYLEKLAHVTATSILQEQAGVSACLLYIIIRPCINTEQISSPDGAQRNPGNLFQSRFPGYGPAGLHPGYKGCIHRFARFNNYRAG